MRVRVKGTGWWQGPHINAGVVSVLTLKVDAYSFALSAAQCMRGRSKIEEGEHHQLPCTSCRV